MVRYALWWHGMDMIHTWKCLFPILRLTPHAGEVTNVVDICHSASHDGWNRQAMDWQLNRQMNQSARRHVIV